MVDALCYDDLDPYGTELNDPVAEIEQDSYHRIIEDYGSNIDDDDAGLGINGILGSALDSSITTKVEAELRKDDRVDAVSATLTQITGSGNAGGGYVLNIQIQPEGDISILLPGGS